MASAQAAFFLSPSYSLPVNEGKIPNYMSHQNINHLQFSGWHEILKARDVKYRNILITLKSIACKDSLKMRHACRSVWWLLAFLCPVHVNKSINNLANKNFGQNQKNLSYQDSVDGHCNGLAVYCRLLGIFHESNRYCCCEFFNEYKFTRIIFGPIPLQLIRAP